MPSNSVQTRTTETGRQTRHRILALAGSLRAQSYNRRLLEWASAHAPEHMQIDVYEDLESIPLFSEDLEVEGSPEAVTTLRQRVIEANGLLIATPEYNHSMPGVLKNVIDWLSRPFLQEVLERKPVAVFGATTGAWGTRYAQSALRQVLTATECLVLPSPALFIRDASTLFDDDGLLVHDKTIAALERLLTAFDAWIDIHQRGHAGRRVPGR